MPANLGARYRQSIDRHLVPHVGGIRLQALTVEDLDRCYATLVRDGGAQGRPLSPKTVRNAHGVVRTALRDAVQRGYLARNVAEHARLPRLVRSDMETWTADQLRTFLAHVAEDRLAAMWTLYATTGLRRGEVLGLRWADVDLDAGQLTVRHVLTVASGTVLSTEPKTAKGRRTIALDASTVGALRRHRVRQLEERVRADVAWQDGDYIFTWEDGRPLHPQLPTKWIASTPPRQGSLRSAFTISDTPGRAWRYVPVCRPRWSLSALAREHLDHAGRLHTRRSGDGCRGR